MGAPGGQAIDALLHGMAEEMSAHQIGQLCDLFGGFLQQEKIGLLGMNEGGDVLGLGADTAQQIPASHSEGVFRTGHGNPIKIMPFAKDTRSNTNQAAAP